MLLRVLECVEQPSTGVAKPAITLSRAVPWLSKQRTPTLLRDCRAIILMPHHERPPAHGELKPRAAQLGGKGPWMGIFRTARVWVG